MPSGKKGGDALKYCLKPDREGDRTEEEGHGLRDRKKGLLREQPPLGKESSMYGNGRRTKRKVTTRRTWSKPPQ